MTRRQRSLLIGGLAAIIALAGAAFTLTPYVYAEYFGWCERHNLSATPPPADPAAFQARPGEPLGTVSNGWLIQQIAPDTYALGEPAEDLDNYEYLLIGRTRALLIDAGNTKRDIRGVLASLTSLPVTVIPTHLHFDHTNGLVNAERIALVDLPETRRQAEGDHYRLSHYQYMRDDPFTFTVSEWVKPETAIDLGGRIVKLLATPGHTSSSISLYDPAAKLLFTGDLIYTTTLYAFDPSSSLSAYVATFDRLLAEMPEDVTIYGAHCCRNDVVGQAPWLNISDVRDARAAILAVRDGTAEGRGFIIRRFPVNSRMTLLTLYPWGNR